MKERSGLSEKEQLREKIMGLGERSFRKSYYPELQKRLADLERFKIFLDQSNDVIFMLDGQGRFTYVSRSMCRQLAYCSDETSRMSVFDIMPSLGREIPASLLQGERESAIFETMLRDRQGRLVPFEVNMRCVAFEHARYIVAVARNIAERQQARETLRASESKYRRLYDSMMDAYARVDMAGKLVEYNQSFLDLLGFSPEEVGKLSYSDMTPERWRAIESRIIQTQVMTRGYSDIYEKEYRRKDGEAIPVELRTFLFRDDAGKPVGFWAIVRDITERKRDRERLEQSNEKLQKLATGIINSISKLVEMRDPYTAGHQRHVSQLSYAIAREMGFVLGQAEWIRIAGLIHDIGKLNVPAEILSKPGRLDAVEFEIIRVHPAAGYEIVRLIDFPLLVSEVVHQHHERMGGTGYPRGLTEDQICMEARIVSVADVVEAMTFPRPYRPVIGLERALQEIDNGKEILYFRPAAEACLRLFKERRFTFDAPLPPKKLIT